MDRREFLSLMASGGVGALAARSAPAFASARRDLIGVDMIGQASLVARGQMTALELIEAAIERIEAVNPKINAVVTPTYNRARRRVRGRRESGQLWGAPYLLKDLTHYRGVRFTQGTRLFENTIADWQSPYTDKTEEAGLVVLGKTNTPEFGLISTTESVALGPCRNPWNLGHSTGGSSGGAAAAVAARLVPAAQASDGGGSIRIPATCCGLFGLKPSRGRFPLQWPRGSGDEWPLSIAHPLSWSVRDSALILALTEAEGPLEPVGYVEGAGRKKRLRVAVSLFDGQGRLPHPEVQRAVKRTASLLESMGHDVGITDAAPLAGEDIEKYFLTYWAYGAAGIREMVRKQTGIAPEESGLLEPWTLGLAKMFDERDVELDEIFERFRQIEREVYSFLDRYDLWLTPVTSSPAPPLGKDGQGQEVPFDLLMERVSRYAAWTPLHNVAGTPAMSVPLHWTREGLPVGVQIAAGLGKERELLEIAYALEEARPWRDRLPPVHG